MFEKPETRKTLERCGSRRWMPKSETPVPSARRPAEVVKKRLLKSPSASHQFGTRGGAGFLWMADQGMTHINSRRRLRKTRRDVAKLKDADYETRFARRDSSERTPRSKRLPPRRANVRGVGRSKTQRNVGEQAAKTGELVKVESCHSRSGIWRSRRLLPESQKISARHAMHTAIVKRSDVESGRSGQKRVLLVMTSRRVRMFMEALWRKKDGVHHGFQASKDAQEKFQAAEEARRSMHRHGLHDAGIKRLDFLRWVGGPTDPVGVYYCDGGERRQIVAGRCAKRVRFLDKASVTPKTFHPTVEAAVMATRGINVARRRRKRRFAKFAAWATHEMERDTDGAKANRKFDTFFAPSPRRAAIF